MLTLFDMRKIVKCKSTELRTLWYQITKTTQSCQSTLGISLYTLNQFNINILLKKDTP